MMGDFIVHAGRRAIILLMAMLVASQLPGMVPALNPAAHSGAAVDAARALVITENFDDAALAYARLLAADSTDAALNAEFAYVLALEGMYDAALIRLDRVRLSEKTVTDFYAHEVLTLMGHAQLADNLLQETAPDWIRDKGPQYLEKYSRTSLSADSLRTEDLTERFKRANRLTTRNASLQSITLFEDLIRQAPGEYLIYVGYSIALERADQADLAASALETGLVLLKEQPGQESNIAILEKRLGTLKQKAETGAKSGTSATAVQAGSEIFNPRMMAYAGGFVSSSYTSLNGRVGSFFTRSNYATFDFGMTSSGGSTYANLGFTVFDRQKIFVLGFGLTGSFGEGSSIFYSKISMGPSFMNKKGTASFDIFLDGKVPLKKGYSTQLGLSIGRSFYFGKRK